MRRKRRNRRYLAKRHSRAKLPIILGSALGGIVLMATVLLIVKGNIFNTTKNNKALMSAEAQMLLDAAPKRQNEKKEPEQAEEPKKKYSLNAPQSQSKEISTEGTMVSGSAQDARDLDKLLDEIADDTEE